MSEVAGPALDRQACKREAGNLHQTLGFDMNLEFQGFKMLLAVTAAEEPQGLVGAGPHREPTGSRRNESPEDGEVEVLFDVLPDPTCCFLRDAVPGPEAATVQFVLRVAGVHTDAEFGPCALQTPYQAQ